MKEWFISKYNCNFTLSNIKKILLKASDMYYNTDSLLMSDSEYDKLLKFYERKSGTKLPVGAKPVGNMLTLSHSYSNFAGTLSKCQNLEDLRLWSRNKKVLKDKDFLCTVKGDGHSITVEFVYDAKAKKIVLDKALTRGSDGVGKDLTELFKKNFSKIPYFKDFKEDYAMGYEAIIMYDDFKKLNEDTNDKYKNPRSAIGGIFSTNGQAYFKYITLLPIKYRHKNRETPRVEQLEKLKTLKNYSYLYLLEGTLEDVNKAYLSFETQRAEGTVELPFMFDGLVIETLNEEKRLKLGYSTTEPNFATALKFSPIDASTTLLDVEWSSEGYSSRLTPVAVFEDVYINGNTYNRVSLANLKRFYLMDLHIGDNLIFSLRNDVLGYIEKSDVPNTDTSKKLLPPTNCDCCGNVLENDGTFLYCPNSNCDYTKIGDLYSFIVKTNTKNIALETIQSVYDAGAVTKPEDLMTVTSKDLLKAKGFANVSAKNFIDEITTSIRNGLKDYILLGSLNINLISTSRAKLILENIDYHILLKLCEDKNYKELSSKLLKVDGLGETTIKSLYEGVIAKLDTLKAFNHLVTSTSELSKNFSSERYSFCHTGDADPLADRSDLKQLLEDKGHKLVGSVSKKTNYLISNDKESVTTKTTKAKELGIPIISVQEALNIINLN